MKELLITGAWRCGEQQVQALEQMGYAVTFWPDERQAVNMDTQRFEAVICGGLFLTTPIERFPALKCIQVTSAGLDRVPLDYCKAHGIIVYNAGGVYSAPMAAFDMYFELDDYVKACVESGFRSVLCGAVSGDKSNLERLENNYLKYNNVDPLISFMLGFHAEYTCEKELIEGVGKLAEKYKAPVAMHNSETAKEVRECIEKYGMTPTELFDSFGIFDFGGAGFHCVHMSDKDLEIFKNKGIWAVHCAGSNVKLASGIAPIVKMQDMGINIAIGTDGPASNNCLDMFREMFLMTGLQKIACDDASACPADSVLKAATVGSARAMGLSDCDIIAEGKQADLIVIDLFQPNMQPLNNIGKNLVYSGSKQNVKLTMCAGKVLYEDGEFRIGEEPAVIYKKANEIIESMKD